MNFVKATTSGQITIPKKIRNKFKTDYFVCQLSENGVLFVPVDLPKEAGKKPHSIKELKAWSFSSKNPKEKNLADKIDSIYTI